MSEIAKKDIWATADLKKLPADEIFDRIEQVVYQSFSIQCKLWYALRCRFKATSEYGDYIQKLLNDPYRAEFVPSQQTRNNMIHAGEYMEKHKIGDLTQAKIRKTSLYLLAAPKYQKVNDAVLKQIRGKNTSPAAVEQMLNNELDGLKRVEFQEMETETELTGIIRTIDVVGGIAMEENTEEYEAVVPGREREAVEATMRSLLGPSVQIDVNSTHNQRYALLRQLALLDAGSVSVEDARQEHDLFIEQYKMGTIREELELLKAFQDDIKDRIAARSSSRYTKR